MHVLLFLMILLLYVNLCAVLVVRCRR